MVQDPAPSSSIQPGPMPHAPDQEKQPLPCPRCESINTKFCYYNNYNLSQPRHFCKDCRRYWTKGGALRNVPIGGATRKNTKRRPSSSLPNNPKRVSLPATPDPLKPDPLSVSYPEDQMSFRSLLGCSGNFVNYLQEGGEMVGAGVELQGSNDTSVSGIPSPPEMGNLLGFQGEYRCWSGGWPDLAIFTTPGSGYQ